MALRHSHRDVEVRSVVPTKIEIALTVGTVATTVTVVGWRRSSGKRSHVSQRLGPQQLCQVASGKCLVFGEFSRYAYDPWNRRRFQRSLPRTRRSRGKLLFRGRPADHRPAEQGLLQPDPVVIDSIAGSNLRRTSSGVWRQDQPGDQGHHAFGAGCDNTTRHGHHLLRFVWFRQRVRFDLAYGGAKWGNFIAVDGLNTGRFLDPPEFSVIHAKGNLENVFDRIDYQLSDKDTIHLNLGFTRSWFQTPNSYDNLNVGVTGPDGEPVGSHRSALEDPNLQHRSDLDAPDQYEHGLYSRRLRSA